MLSFGLINRNCQVSDPGPKDPLVYSVMDINDLEFGVEFANALWCTPPFRSTPLVLKYLGSITTNYD